MLTPLRLALCFTAVLFLAGCGPVAATDDGGNDAPDDAGVTDAGVTDAGVTDAGVTDAGVTDAGPDAGPSDAGADAGVPGAACSAADDCASGFCVDGVCCETACDGLCESCALADRAGFCDAIPATEDPADECAAQAASTCGTTGACSGARTCALHAGGTVCTPASCSGTVSSLADTCDGLGACIDNGSASCEPLACDATTGLCRVACTVSGDCASGFSCASGVCKKAAGVSCGAATECASGFCADGVCCDSACGGTCETCNLAGRVGTCDPIAAGMDPDGECATQAASTCGTTGVCDGSRACQRFASGTVCAAASCAGSVSSAADTCDGAGACVDRGTTDCAPFQCNTANGTCLATCATGADCVSGFSCVSGGCKKSQGGPCGGGSECASGFCVDGVCCDGPCGGPCEQCDLAPNVGSCSATAIGQDPANECAAQAATSCGTTGVCSGARSCELYAAGTTCAAPSCSSGSQTNARTCDGAGNCESNGTQSCAPFQCNTANGTCLSTCTTGADCVSGFTCASGVCKTAPGGACARDSACGSGFCSDGVCCTSRCGGTCEQCNAAGSLGSCSAVPAGQDLENECATQPAATCGTTGVCSGARSCALYSSGTVCSAAFCSNAVTAAPADTCNGSGTCTDSGTVSCGNYLCNGATGLCRTSCATSADCSGLATCVGSSCQ